MKSLRRNSKSIAVERIRAGLDADADYAAGVIAEIGAGVLGDDVELLNRVHVGRVGDFVVLGFLIDDAVEEKSNRLLAIAVDVGTAGTGHQLGLRETLGLTVVAPGESSDN